MTLQRPIEVHGGRSFGGLWLLALLASCVALMLSAYSQLFGPRGFVMFGIVGFLLGAAGWVVAQKLFLPANPRGLTDAWPGAGRLDKPTAWVANVFGLIAGISIVTMLLSARLDGVTSGGFPVFAAREKYELENHGRKTIVSPTRYLAIGASFVLGWHSLALYFSVSAMRIFMFGSRALETRANEETNPRGYVI
jgi:hypothetical protein